MTKLRMVHMGRFIITALAALVALLAGAPPAQADEISGCESGPVLGLSPGIRKICDGQIRPDGTWVRWNQFISLDKTRSSCGGIFYQGGICPPWNNQRDFSSGGIGVPQRYWLTADTVPSGEPGHLDNPIRCSDTALRCDVP